MNKWILLLLFAAFVSSCQDTTPCQSLDTGTVCIENTLNEALKVYVNGQYYKTIYPGQEQCSDGIPAGDLSVTAFGAISNKNYLDHRTLETCSLERIEF